MSETILCAACGTPIPSNTPEDQPCHCGSTARTRHVAVRAEDTLEFHENLGFKARRHGEPKPYIEGTTGDDLRRSTGEWMQKERVIDRDNDSYREVVTDPKTGNVIHKCEEPLKKHQGHGSAKTMSGDRRYQHVKEKLKAMGDGTAKEVQTALKPTPYSESEVENELDRMVSEEPDEFEKVGPRYRWKKSYKFRIGLPR